MGCASFLQLLMGISVIDLPYDLGALEPHISKETLDFHYNKHHAGYATKLNAALGDKESNLEALVRDTKVGSSVFNNAAQVWNHDFYWQSLSPQGGGEPKGDLAEAIRASFGSFENFKQEFSQQAAGQFGSGWAWLVKKGTRLEVQATGNADTPLRDPECRPLLTCDVWEHAYYIDYRNARPKYIDAWWNLVNWDFAAKLY